MGLVFLAARSSAADGRGRAGAPAGLSAPDVLTGTCAGWNSWPLSSLSRSWHHRIRSPSAAWRARRVALAGTCRPEAGRRQGVRIRQAIEEHLFSGAFQPQLHPAARSYDRHLTVGLAVTGRRPAARTGPERNMPAPNDPCGPLGTARVSPPHLSSRAAGHGSSLPVGCCCPATRHRAVNPRKCAW